MANIKYTSCEVLKRREQIIKKEVTEILIKAGMEDPECVTLKYLMSYSKELKRDIPAVFFSCRKFNLTGVDREARLSVLKGLENLVRNHHLSMAEPYIVDSVFARRYGSDGCRLTTSSWGERTVYGKIPIADGWLHLDKGHAERWNDNLRYGESYKHPSEVSLNYLTT